MGESVASDEGSSWGRVLELASMLDPGYPALEHPVDIGCVSTVPGHLRSVKKPFHSDAVTPEPELPRICHQQVGCPTAPFHSSHSREFDTHMMSIHPSISSGSTASATTCEPYYRG